MPSDAAMKVAAEVCPYGSTSFRDAAAAVIERAIADAVAEERAKAEALAEALRDMRAGWRYIRHVHGDLSGVGWDRCENSSTAALKAWEK